MKIKILKKIVFCVSVMALAGCQLNMTNYGGGKITSASEAFNCDEASCTYDFPEGGLKETFTAVPDEGYEFTGWEKLCEDETGLTCSLDLPNDFLGLTLTVELIARFRKEDHAIISPVTNGYSAKGEWVLSGGDNKNSPSNHHYKFSVTEDGFLDIQIDSPDAGPGLILIDSTGFVVDSDYRGGNFLRRELGVTAGDYTIVAATRYDLQSGAYTLTLLGEINDFLQIETDRNTVADSWELSGGDNRNSFRNNHYNVTVTEDSFLGIQIDSPDAGPGLILIDSTGFVVDSDYRGGNFLRRELEVTAGDYTIVAATRDDLQSGAYTLTLTGKFQNLVKRIDGNTKIVAGTWTDAGSSKDNPGNIRYSLTVTEDSTLDYFIDSPDAGPGLILIDSTGFVVDSDYRGGNFLRRELEVTAGDYTIVAATRDENQSGTFRLNINGIFTDFQVQ